MKLLPSDSLRTQKHIETIEAVFPKASVVADPLGGMGERRSIQTYGPKLRLAAAQNEPSSLKHLQVFGDSRLLEVEGFNEFVDGRSSLHEPRENRASRRIGQCAENMVKLRLRSHMYIVLWLYS